MSKGSASIKFHQRALTIEGATGDRKQDAASAKAKFINRLAKSRSRSPSPQRSKVSEAVLSDPAVMAKLSPEEKASAFVSATPEQKASVLLSMDPAEREAVAAAQSALAQDSVSDSRMRIEEMAQSAGIGLEKTQEERGEATRETEDRQASPERAEQAGQDEGAGEGQQKGIDVLIGEEGDDPPMAMRFGGKMQSLNTVKQASIFANEARCVSMRTMSAALKMLETQADEIDSVKEELGKIKRRSLLTTAAKDGRAKGLVAEFPTLTSPSRVQRVKDDDQPGMTPLESGLAPDQVEEALQATYNPNRARLFKQFGWTLHSYS